MGSLSDDAGSEHHPAGFSEFYRSTAARTFAIACRAAGNHEVARDATQEAYVVMLERWGERMSRSVLDNGRYVIGIAVRKVADWHRQQLRVIGLTEDDDYGDEDTGFSEILDELSVMQAVRTLISQQPTRRRAVAVLYFLDEWTYAEIAEILAISESTARTHVERLRKQLKPLIDRASEFGQGGERS